MGNVHLAKSKGQNPYKYASSKLDDSELLGIEADGAPLAKLLVAIVSQARTDDMTAVSFNFPPESQNFNVLFWKECLTFEPKGEPMEAMSIPLNLCNALLSHAVWMINHQDPMFNSARGTMLFHEPNYEPAKWPESAPKCRCWLRDPEDVSSLVIQILS